jgi:membrane-anchored glycerophosphoryl diester phosphodiesterase (GDPDase)
VTLLVFFLYLKLRCLPFQDICIEVVLAAKVRYPAIGGFNEVLDVWTMTWNWALESKICSNGLNS